MARKKDDRLGLCHSEPPSLRSRTGSGRRISNGRSFAIAQDDSASIAIVAFTQAGDALAEKIKTQYPHAKVFSKVSGSLRLPIAQFLKKSWNRYDGLVLICAMGIVMRSVSGLMQSKKTDPAILVLDEKGRYVISALSGHAGGANAWAQALAQKIGGASVITTASDSQDIFSLDVLAAEKNWNLENTRDLTKIASLLVNQRPVALLQEAAERLTRLPSHVTVFDSLESLRRSGQKCNGAIVISDRVFSWDFRPTVWLRPRTLCLGIGCERGVSAQCIERGAKAFLKSHRLAFDSLGQIATVDIKKDEKGIVEFAKKYQLPIRFFAPQDLRAIPVPNPSVHVACAVGTPSVAEAAALKATGSRQLLANKWIHQGKATFAVAREVVQPKKGSVTFIGAGPGDPDLLTIAARKRIGQADIILFAGSLIPPALMQSLPVMAQKINTASMDLETTSQIVHKAVQEGKHVVRLQSGDLSLYSAVGEQTKILDEAGIDYELIPGISSFQAAAAKLKKELTIPEEVQTIILTRAQGNTNMPAREQLRALAAHRASLCLFLAGRLMAKVQEDLLAAYPADTPAVIAYRLYWPDEKIIQTTVDRIAEVVEKNKFVRTTLVLVGTAWGEKRARSRLYHPAHGHLFRTSKILSSLSLRERVRVRG